MKSKISILIALVLIFALTATGCGLSAEPVIEETGTILLKVNPEIAVTYNKEGKVTEVAGVNSDGKDILAGYSNYIGKPSAVVVKELVKRINDKGYFLEDVNSEKRQITLELVENSYVPQQTFFDDLVADLSEVATEIETKPNIVGYNHSAAQKQKITGEQALKIALEHSGVSADDAVITQREHDIENGKFVYEIEFRNAGGKYEYKISADTGDIIEFSSSLKVAPAKPAETTPKTPEGDRPGAEYITLEKAKAIAFSDAQVKESELTALKTELDTENGRKIYEIDFTSSSGFKYEYDIDAYTGEIIKKELKDKTSQTKPNTEKTDTESKTTAEQAKTIALNHAGVKAENATFKKVKMNTHKGRPVWELKFFTGDAKYKYEIEVSNGQILLSDKNYFDYDSDDSNEYNNNVKKPEISAEDISREKAIEIALKHAGVAMADARFDEVDLDHDDGYTVWEIEFDAGQFEYEFKIDAKNGNILKYKIDD